MGKIKQQGGTLLGFIFGLIIGLGVALAVVMFITKNPIPLENKGPKKIDQSGKGNTDPNMPIYGKNAKLGEKPLEDKEASSEDDEGKEVDDSTTNKPKDSKASKTEKQDEKNKKNTDTKDPKAKDSKSKESDSKTAKDESSDSEPKRARYYVQLGVFNDKEKAEALKANAALAGVQVKIEVKEKNGKEMYRVKTGIIRDEDTAKETSEKLKKQSINGRVLQDKAVSE